MEKVASIQALTVVRRICLKSHHGSSAIKPC